MVSHYFHGDFDHAFNLRGEKNRAYIGAFGREAGANYFSATDAGAGESSNRSSGSGA